MIYYVYDGTFDGLFTAIYDAYYNKNKPEEIVKDEDFLPTLLTEPIYIKTDEEKASKVLKALIDKVSYETLRYVFYVFLSEEKGCSTLIYRYVRLAFNLKKDINMHIHNSIVLEVHKTTKRVCNEKHRMLGFLRFKFVGDNLYYAPIEPDHNILQLITPHFARRFSSQNFIIHDRKRELASMYNGEDWVVTNLLKEYGDKLMHNSSDFFYEKLWKEYFKSAAIENRKNLRLQKRYMPERYWKFLNEIN